MIKAGKKKGYSERVAQAVIKIKRISFNRNSKPDLKLVELVCNELKVSSILVRSIVGFDFDKID